MARNGEHQPHYLTPGTGRPKSSGTTQKVVHSSSTTLAFILVPKMQFYCSNFPLLPTTSQLCCYIGKHEKAKGLDYISKGRNVGSAARSSFKFSRQSWTIGENHTYSGIVRKILHELTSLPADVLWGSFVTHSFLRGGEMNA